MDSKKRNTILVTGCAGFIGMHISKKLCEIGFNVAGIDNLNDYYDVDLKKKRLEVLKKSSLFTFSQIDIRNLESLNDVFKKYSPNKVINLAAQAGVRYSLTNPHTYIETNIVGFMNLIECCRNFRVEGLVYASSSSVYGGNKKIPFSESDNVDNPISIYAASKKANELMANTYYKLYGLKSTGLRFFTVYGPWGRPDMALYIFTKKILNNEPIQIFNFGKMERDFTYIDDIIHGIYSALKINHDLKIFNLGNSKSENLLDVVSLIENELNKKAIIDLAPMQLGDVRTTFADITDAKNELGFEPKTDVSYGIKKFVTWFKEYHKLK